MELGYDIEGGNFTKAGFASSEVKKVLKQLNVNPKIIKRVVVALFEGEVNVVAHAYRGRITVKIDTGKIDIRIDDEGPGIPDIEMAMKEGFSTASEKVREMGFGAGMGLSNMKRNADELDIQSVVGRGTSVNLVTYLNG
jgi:anti-sigma regulatory factor (Ser/Thr protein kinase)